MSPFERSVLLVGLAIAEMIFLGMLGLLDAWSASGIITGAVLAYFIGGLIYKEDK